MADVEVVGITVVETEADCPPAADELCDPGPQDPGDPVREVEVRVRGLSYRYRATDTEWALVPTN